MTSNVDYQGNNIIGDDINYDKSKTENERRKEKKEKRREELGIKL